MSCALRVKTATNQPHRPLAPGGGRPQNGAGGASPLRFLRRGRCAAITKKTVADAFSIQRLHIYRLHCFTNSFAAFGTRNPVRFPIKILGSPQLNPLNRLQVEDEAPQGKPLLLNHQPCEPQFHHLCFLQMAKMLTPHFLK